MFPVLTFSSHKASVNPSGQGDLREANFSEHSLLRASSNPFGPRIPSLGESTHDAFNPLFLSALRLKPAYTSLYDTSLKDIANNPNETSLKRVQSALRLAESDEKDQILQNLILGNSIQNVSQLGSCFLAIANTSLREAVFDQYLQRADTSLHLVLTQSKAHIQGRLFSVLSQHGKILLRLIFQENLPFFWRLYYTFMLPSDVAPGERGPAEQRVVDASRCGCSALALLEDIRVAIRHHPNSASRNPILERFIDERQTFTPGQCIELLSFMGESPEKDNKALALSQEEAFFTLDQQAVCIAYMSPSPQKERALKDLELKIQEAAKVNPRAAE